MTVKATTVFLAAIFASQVALTGVSFADGKKGSRRYTVINLKAKLAPPPPLVVPVTADVSDEIEGKAKYQQKTNNLTGDTKEKFKGEVEFPLDMVNPDFAAAAAAEYEMRLFHALETEPYARCSLVITEIEFEYSRLDPVMPAEIEAKYVVDVSQRTPALGTPTLREKVGSCDVFPVVEAGDTATVFDTTSQEVLTGTFVAHSGHHDDD